MSFGINGPDNNLSAIQKSHHANDGGAGNLGYFQQEKQDKEKKKDEQDVFESSSKKKDNKDTDSFEKSQLKLDSIGTKIKNFWLTLKNKNNTEKKPEDESTSGI